MTDTAKLIERLRYEAGEYAAISHEYALLLEAADEIERLRFERDAAISVGVKARSREDEANEQAEKAEAALAEARRILRDMICPRPCNNRPDNFTVGQCFDAGECGCICVDHLAALPKDGEQ